MTVDGAPEEKLICRTHEGNGPTLVYLPGVHGDWTLVGSFRTAVQPHTKFVEFCYPRTLEWSIRDYGEAVRRALVEHGHSRVWVLGESFGSQVAWQLLEASRVAGEPKIEGIVLAGGFVRYPYPRLARAVRWGMARVPGEGWKWLFAPYAKYANFRHRHAPEAKRGVAEFLERRTPPDLRAILHRLDLIVGHDPGEIARRCAVPIYALTGGIDPVVPAWPAMRWLKRKCPAFREMRVIWPADHNVLSTQPAEAARVILGWMRPEQP